MGIAITQDINLDISAYIKELTKLEREVDAAVRRVEGRFKNAQTQFGVRSEAATFNMANEARQRFAATGGGAAGGSAGGGGFLGSTEILSKGLLAATAATKGLEVGMSAVDLIAASISGEYEDQVAAVSAMRNTIAEIPVFGKAIVEFGEAFNKHIIARATGEKAYLEMMERERLVQEQVIKAQERQVELAKKFREASETLVKDSKFDQRTQTQKEDDELNALIKRRDKLMQDPRARGADGKMNPGTAADLAQIDAAIGKRGAEIEKDRYERALAHDTELQSHRLRAEGKIAEAERMEYVQTLRQRELAAEKIGAAEVENVRRVNEAAIDAFDRRQAAEREAKRNEERREAAVAEQKQRDDVQAVLDKQRAEETRIQDMEQGIAGRNLRASGMDRTADIAEIQAEYEKRLAEAAAKFGGGVFGLNNSDFLREAELAGADAQSRIAMMQREDRDRAGVELVSMSRQSLSGGASGDTVQKDIATATKTTNDLLREIRDKATGGTFG